MSNFGRITNITYIEYPRAGMAPQKPAILRVDVIHDPLPDTHEVVSSQRLSLSGRDAGRLKAWFEMFGLGNLPNMDVDDATNLLIEPDLTGTPVTFSVKAGGDIVIEGVAHPSKCNACGSWSQA